MTQVIAGILAGTFGIVLVVMVLVLLAPAAGTASAGVVSTGNTLTNIMAFLAMIVASGLVLVAIGGRRK